VPENERTSVPARSKQASRNGEVVGRKNDVRSMRGPAREAIPISAVCSMVNCTGAPIAAMKVSDFWVSQCLRHSKGHGKLDMNKVTRS
jgi:hypothetical protein